MADLITRNVECLYNLGENTPADVVTDVARAIREDNLANPDVTSYVVIIRPRDQHIED